LDTGDGGRVASAGRRRRRLARPRCRTQRIAAEVEDLTLHLGGLLYPAIQHNWSYIAGRVQKVQSLTCRCGIMIELCLRTSLGVLG